MADMIKAILFLSAVTFIIAIGSAVVQGVAFYKRYRIHLQISSKRPSIDHRDLMSVAPGTIPLISSPVNLAHSRQDTALGSQRWPEYPDRRRPSYMARSMPPGSVNLNMNPAANPTLNPSQFCPSDHS